MKKVLVLIFLSVMALSTYASYFEVQVPMSDKRSETQMFECKPLAVGHFRTTTPTLDPYGRAYIPGQTPAGSDGPHRAKKVGHDEDEDDPFMPSQVAPIGDIPWIFFSLLALAVAFCKRFRISTLFGFSHFCNNIEH